MKYICNIIIILIFGSVFVTSGTCQKNCIIDTIFYKEYEVNFMYNEERYSDINLMMVNKNLKKDWIAIYQDNKIYKRILGNTLGGSNRVEKFYYNEKGLLDSIYDTGSFKKRLKFIYNAKGKLAQINSYSLLGNTKEYFEFKKGNVIRRTKNSETGNYDEYVVNLEQAKKHCFKFGNIECLDDSYGLADNSNEEYGYKEEFKYDECGNKILYVVRNPESGIILNLYVFKYIYK